MISNCIFAVMSVIEWDLGMMDGCGGAYLMNYLPQRILKAFFFQLQRKERQGLAQLGQLIFCLILWVSISFPIIRLSFWFSFEGPIFFLSFFWVLIFRFWFFFSNFLSTSKEEEGAPQVGKLIYGSLQVLCQKRATAITDILPAVAGNLSLFFKKMTWIAILW